MTRIGVRYPGGTYMPGGRDWQFRAPRLLEVVLTITPSSRIRQWTYGHWPVQSRQSGTTF